MPNIIEVESGYHCPFCPNHQDDKFYISALINVPICAGCQEQLFHYSRFHARPDDPLIEKVERHTGKLWSECKVILLQASLAYWKNVEGGQQQDWLRTAMDKLDWSEEEAWSYVQKQIQTYQSLLREAEEN